MVTAIIAPPMSIPLPLAVMPPACDKPDYGTRQPRILTYKNHPTHRHQKQHTRHHRRERRPAHLARVHIPQQAHRERANRAHDIRPVEDVVVRQLVRHVRAARYDHHHRELFAPEGLQVREGGQRREEGHDDGRSPDREGLEIPWEALRAVASVDDIVLAERDGVGECPGASDGYTVIDGSIVGHPASCQRDSGRDVGRKLVKLLSHSLVEEKVEIGADLQTKTLDLASAWY